MENKTWNQQLRDWYVNQGTAYQRSGKIRDIGIPRKTMNNYINGKTKNLSNISSERKQILYSLTGLEIFNTEKPQSQLDSEHVFDYSENAEFSEAISELQNGLTQLVQSTVEKLGLPNNERLRQGLTKSQQYQASAEQRADGVMELLDMVAAEVDYFRTASEDETKILVDKLKADPDSFGYATQMINILYEGKQINNWMLIAQPPTKLRRKHGN